MLSTATSETKEADSVKSQVRSSEHIAAGLDRAIPRPTSSRIQHLARLQSSIGNQAVLRMMRAQTVQPSTQVSAAPIPGSIQAKLRVGSVNDPLEHEADRVADHVMNMPASEVSVAAAPPRISRKCESCEEEDKTTLQKKSAGRQATAGEVPRLVREVLGSPGQPLDPATRDFMGQRFGYDFSRVRVHSGAAAEQSARDVNAHAYTVGHHIVFGAGRLALETLEGRRLLAHELTHVLQQSSADRNSVGQNDGTLGPAPVTYLSSARAQIVQRNGRQEEEEQRDNDRRDRRSTTSRRNRQELGLADPFDNLDSDWAGRMILAQYLYGGGKKVEVRDDPAWTAYMTKSQRLRKQVWVQVIAAAKDLVQLGKPGRRPTVTRFHGEFENGEGIIGYQYLHGTNQDVGDFAIVGFGEVTRFQGPHSAVVHQNPFALPKLVQQGAGARVDFELSFIWNDIIDPNGAYISDKIKSAFAYVITLGQPKNYEISIGWYNTCSVWLPASGGQQVTDGYPEL
jgi:hypothetical protein